MSYKELFESENDDQKRMTHYVYGLFIQLRLHLLELFFCFKEDKDVGYLLLYIYDQFYEKGAKEFIQTYGEFIEDKKEGFVLSEDQLKRFLEFKANRVDNEEENDLFI